MKKVVDVSKDEWIIAENDREAIIDKKLIEKVQNILDRKLSYSKNNDLLQKYLKCFECGKSMILKKVKKSTYYCTSFVRDRRCTNHSIRKDVLMDLLKDELCDKINTKDLKETNLDGIIDKIYIK